MTLEQKYQELYEIGLPIFLKLFKLKKDDFVRVMEDIFHDNKDILRLFENKPKIIKTLCDDEPESISASFYDVLSINYFGVIYKPEHGQQNMVLRFDKFFNIDAALGEVTY